MPRRTGRHWREVIVPHILDRDAGICHLCGRPGADSADHIIPTSKGGAEYEDHNLAAVHHKVWPRCNIRRGDRSVEQARALISAYIRKQQPRHDVWSW